MPNHPTNPLARQRHTTPTLQAPHAQGVEPYGREQLITHTPVGHHAWGMAVIGESSLWCLWGDWRCLLARMCVT